MRNFFRLILVLLVFVAISYASDAQTFDIPLPQGVQGISSRSKITVLSNGNFVYSNPDYGVEGRPDIGMVRLYNGKTFSVITTITGTGMEIRSGIGFTRFRMVIL